MAESILPTTWTDARNIILANVPWILLLIAGERAFEFHYLQALIALVGCVVALAIAVHWKVFEGLGESGGRKRLAFILIAIGTIFLAVGIYLLATQPLATIAAGDNSTLAAAQPPISPSQASPVQEELGQAKSQLQAERDARAAIDRQLATTRRQLQEAENQRDAALRAAAEKQHSDASTTPAGPVNWYMDSQLLVVSGGAQNAEVNGILVMGISTASVAIKEAYAVSGFTGRRQNLMANVQSQGAYYPVEKVDIPSGAPVQLDLIFKPALPIRDFLDQWGKFKVTITYSDGTSYQREYDESYVRQKLQQMVPSAFGPRMTPRE